MSSSVTAFVFTDLMDSTATAARLGPEASEESRQTHFRLLRSALSASGGVEVKNLGDGLMVMYSSPSRRWRARSGCNKRSGITTAPPTNRCVCGSVSVRAKPSRKTAISSVIRSWKQRSVCPWQVGDREFGHANIVIRHTLKVVISSPFHSRRVPGVNGVTHHRVHGVCREERRA